MPGPLADCWAKFNWAKRHTESLDSQFIFWRTFYARPATTNLRKEFNRRTNCFTYWLNKPAPIFPEMWLTMGDVVNNYRASLDYLSLILVERGRTPHPKSPTLVQFPIFSDRTVYNAWLDRRLPGVRRQHRAIVRRYQPYHRRKRANRHPLAILADLSNKDKHRKLQQTFTRVFESAIAPTIRGINFDATKIWVPAALSPNIAQGKAKFLQIWGVPTGTGQPDVKVNFKTTATITFDNGLRVDAVLNSISETVFSILREFEGLLNP